MKKNSWKKFSGGKRVKRQKCWEAKVQGGKREGGKREGGKNAGMQ